MSLSKQNCGFKSMKRLFLSYVVYVQTEQLRLKKREQNIPGLQNMLGIMSRILKMFFKQIHQMMKKTFTLIKFAQSVTNVCALK